MLSKEKPDWQQVPAQASIFCLNLEAVKPPGVGWQEGLVTWQLLLLWKGRSRVSQQSSSPELPSGSEGCRCVVGGPVGSTGQDLGY